MNAALVEQPQPWELSAAEARVLTEEAKKTGLIFWNQLLHLYEGNAHGVLGYASWGAYYECEFGQHRSRGYQLLNSARVVALLPAEVHQSNVLDRQLQPLAPLLKTEPEAIPAIWREAQARAAQQQRDVTSVDVQEIIRERREIQPQADAHAARSMAIATRAAEETQAAPGELYDRIVQADVRNYLPRLHREGYRAHVCLTSPPYWAKRTYLGGDAEIGQEDTPAAYIAHVLEVCDLIGQVLTPDGWLFLNLGDTFANQPGQYRGDPDRARGVSTKVRDAAAGGRADRQWDVPDKSLCLIPWRILLALVERGWRCRNVNIWHKIGHQPENVFDRSAQAWEPVLQLTRAAYVHYTRGAGDDDVWALAVGRGGKGGAHPAVFPDALVERVLSRACPPGGVVLDPFAGSGTVLHVAQRLGRRFLGCDLIDWNAAPVPTPITEEATADG